MVNTFILVFLINLSLSTSKQNDTIDKYHKYNVCDFKWCTGNLKELEHVSIIKYSITNDINLKQFPISSYFLIASQKDTFNVISIYNGKISDSIILEYRWSKNWNFKPEKIKCLDFYSKSNLNININSKYPLIYGLVFGEFD
ncbi:MAG: hypothetical protein C0446_00640 [Chitinophaga sp.]|nr:hypothetical protein [Chitinophaga sp.]